MKFLHDAIALPWVYDQVQRLAGADAVRRRLRVRLAEAANQTVLDLGAGTGLYKHCLPDSARYVWVDADPLKLHGFRVSYPDHRLALLGAGVQGMNSRTASTTAP